MKWGKGWQGKEGPRYAAIPAVLGGMAPSNTTDIAFCASLVQNPPTSPSQALVRLNKPIASSSTTHTPPKKVS